MISCNDVYIYSMISAISCNFHLSHGFLRFSVLITAEIGCAVGDQDPLNPVKRNEVRPKNPRNDGGTGTGQCQLGFRWI